VSTSMSLQRIKGTFDILPDAYDLGDTTIFSAAAWTYVEGVVRDVFARFNFEEIRTPVIEPTELVARGVGQSSDIVQKEMFAFRRGDTDYVLRPEVTAPVMRAYLEHRLDQRGGVQKLFYIGPCFRAEQPQKGRYRQFHQFGTETLGTDDPRADAETIACMMAVYDAFGLTNTRLRINTLGDAEGRPRFREALRTYLDPHLDRLSETSRRRLETNPLRILDTKLEHEREILRDAPRLIDFVGDEAREHYEAVQAFLRDVGVCFQEDPALVRGLDYYTRTAFELESPDLGAQSALAGGGRYDGLAEAVGSKQRVPAVGYAAGFERLFLALQANNARLPGTEAPVAFFVAMGDEATRAAFGLTHRLRGSGLRVGLDLQGRSFKAQMREANRQQARFAVILGEDELSAGIVQLKDLSSGEQRAVSLGELTSALRQPAAAPVGPHSV
jgi:histidyl-tRNA synthetase